MKTMWLAFALALALAVPAFAQARTAGSSHVEIGFAIGVVRPAVVIDEAGGLRTRPIAIENGDSHRMVTRDVVGRVSWNRHTSTMGSVGWSGESTKEYGYPRVPPDFPFTSYRSHVTTVYRNRSIAVSQTLDVPISNVVVPYLGGGMEFRWVVRTQRTISLRYSDSSPAFDTVDKRAATQQSVFGTAGARFLMGRHATAFVEGIAYFHALEGELSDLRKDASSYYGNYPWRWRAGVGVRF